MSNVVKFVPPPLDLLCDAHPGITPSSTATLPASTLASTMAFTGTNLIVSPGDERKWARRKAYAALDDRHPQGMPVGLQVKAVHAEVINYCHERGWSAPGTQTIRRAIRDRYHSVSTVGSSW